MTLNELINIASAAYSDGLIAVEYWDFKRERPRRNSNGGDTLALFIANEIADTYDQEAAETDQIATAVRAVERAAEELSQVATAIRGRGKEVAP